MPGLSLKMNIDTLNIEGSSEVHSWVSHKRQVALGSQQF